jgi:hypothetical protein
VNRLVQVAGEMPLAVGAALLASADGYTPRANAALDRAREELGAIEDISNALADNLPAPKLTARKSRRRRRKRKGQPQAAPATAEPGGDGASPAAPSEDGEPVEIPVAEDAA